MYHFIIRRKLRQAFQQLSSGEYENTLKGVAPQFEHVFAGNHTFGGTRHTVDSFRRWFERLFLVFPDLSFEIRNILVSGWPWNTLAVVEWVDRATTRNGTPYVNEGVHIMRLRWGRVVEFHVYLDTQKLAEACQHQAEQGLTEAVAPPIVD